MGKPIWGWDDEYGDDVVAIQHAKGATEEEERGDYRMVQMMHENGKGKNEGMEHLRVPSQDKDQPILTETHPINTGFIYI